MNQGTFKSESQREKTAQLIELMDAWGAFLWVEMPAENPDEGAGEDSRPGAETGEKNKEGKALWTELEEARAQNEDLERQLM